MKNLTTTDELIEYFGTCIADLKLLQRVMPTNEIVNWIRNSVFLDEAENYSQLYFFNQSDFKNCTPTVPSLPEKPEINSTEEEFNEYYEKMDIIWDKIIKNMLDSLINLEMDANRIDNALIEFKKLKEYL